MKCCKSTPVLSVYECEPTAKKPSLPLANSELESRDSENETNELELSTLHCELSTCHYPPNIIQSDQSDWIY